MKVTIYGGTNNENYSKEEIAECDKLGKFLAKSDMTTLTGACYGYPYYVGRAAVKHGGRVIGYSPAVDLEEHIEKYKFPTDGVSELEFIAKDGVSKADNFLRRSMDMSSFSDVVVAMGGSWGTYSELIFSFFYKKTIILVDNCKFDGATQAFLKTWEYFDQRENNPHVHLGATIWHAKDIAETCRLLERLKGE